jgi:hypothetical protein
MGVFIMAIIKRTKTSNYLQLHNQAVQEGLDDLQAIGLLTYIMSLPEDWTLHKTHLQNKFSRRKVDSAWKILLENRYAVGFVCYINGKKTYFYNVSDIPFEEEEYLTFVDEQLKEILKESSSVYSVSEIKDNYFPIPNSEEDFSTVQNVQYTAYSTLRTVQNVQLQKKYNTNKQEQKNTNKEILVNKNVDNSSLEYQDTSDIEKEYLEEGLSLEVIQRVKEEIANKQEPVHHYEAYLRTCLDNTLHKHRLKRDMIDQPYPHLPANHPLNYNWLQDGS